MAIYYKNKIKDWIMNININISDSSESQSIHLLTNVIECLQTEKTNFANKYNTMETDKNTVDTELAKVKKDYETLEREKNILNGNYTQLKGDYETLESEKNILNGNYTQLKEDYETLENEKNILNGNYTQLKKDYETLESEKNILNGNYTQLKKDYETLESEKNILNGNYTQLKGDYETLKAEKRDADDKISNLEKLYKRERTNVFIESIKQVSLMLKISLNSDLDTKWAKYIEQIIDDIDNFMSDVKTIEDIKLKIVSRNGWFSKVASIRWWSEATSVKDLLPSTLQKDSEFYHSFYNLQHKMKEFDIDIQIPSCDFSNKIENYKADYDGDTIVKTLFPQYSTEQFVLCEINFVSYNGHTGKCIGYAVN